MGYFVILFYFFSLKLVCIWIVDLKGNDTAHHKKKVTKEIEQRYWIAVFVSVLLEQNQHHLLLSVLSITGAFFLPRWRLGEMNHMPEKLNEEENVYFQGGLRLK